MTGASNEEGIEPMHEWFGLTYANYLTLPRSVIQSMPDEWQARLRRCLDDLDEAAGHLDWPYSYRVQPIDERGRFVRDPMPHYQRGRTRVPLRPYGQGVQEGTHQEE
jgi:hypothetical protein